jgi:hypothetical protein
MTVQLFVQPFQRNSPNNTIRLRSFNSRPVVNHPIFPFRRERHWTFAEVTAASKDRPDLKTPSMPISLKFSQCPSCRTSLLRFLIPLICEGTGLSEFSVRSQRDFLRCDTKILSNCRAAHQKVPDRLTKSARMIHQM